VQYVLIELGDPIVSVEDKIGSEKGGGTSTHLTVYPNPAQGLFRIDLPQMGFEKVDIIDVLGRTVFSKTINPSQTFLHLHPNLASGLYFVRLFKNKDVTSTKLMIYK
jgi:hypothetical protein